MDQEEFSAKLNSSDVEKRKSALKIAEHTFYDMSNKEQIYNDLSRLKEDADKDVRQQLVSFLIKNFSILPDREKGWDDLVTLTDDPTHIVRFMAIEALGDALPYISDKKKHGSLYLLC